MSRGGYRIQRNPYDGLGHQPDGFQHSCTAVAVAVGIIIIICVVLLAARCHLKSPTKIDAVAVFDALAIFVGTLAQIFVRGVRHDDGQVENCGGGYGF